MNRWSLTRGLLVASAILLTWEECQAQSRGLFRRRSATVARTGRTAYSFLSLLDQLDAAVPEQLKDCSPVTAQQVADISKRLLETAADEVWAAQRRWNETAQQRVASRDAQEGIQLLHALLETRRFIDGQWSAMITLRHRFSRLPESESRQQQLRSYLRIASGLIDLSGRFRYLLRDAIDETAYVLDPFPAQFNQMIWLLTKERVSIAAEVLDYVLFDPDPGGEAVAYPERTRALVLELLAACRAAESLPTLVNLLRSPEVTIPLKVRAAEIIREIGLPQDPWPGQDPGLPAPSIRAGELFELASQWSQRGLDRNQRMRLLTLLRWLDERRRLGVTGNSLRVAGNDVRAGDWLLMRNPSPYNHFTDLSPGLFTHVGVVSEVTDGDGRRHFVIVDLPERGDRIPVTNVDIYLQRTLHYWFLRHWDLGFGQRMGKTVADWIGRPTHFDLTFRTERVRQQPRPLPADAEIHTYCAGLLLMCALQNGGRERDFFPIGEQAAPGLAADNLKQLGVMMGHDVVSPTGAIFGSSMQLVARSAPMYEPGREIRESIYDFFAQQIVSRPVRLTPTFSQQLRQRLAALSVNSRWLAKALAKANNVSERMDLEAAAKIAIAVETLDQIAEENQSQFEEARSAFSEEVESSPGALKKSSPEQQRAMLRERHQQLWQRWQQSQLTPRQLRRELVQYYVRRGEEAVMVRFFRETSP
jgi:hypothetical protein